MTEAVLKALRESSKGQLPYDPYWLQDGRWPEILGAAETFQLDSRLLPRSFEEDDAVRGPEEPESTPESVAEPAEQDPKPSNDDTQDLTLFVDTSGTDLSILEYEEERLNSVREALRKRWAQHDQQLQKWQQQAQKHVLLMERDQLLEYQRQLDRLNRDYAQGLQDLAEKKEKVQEHHKNHARHLRNKIKEAELKQKQLEEEERKNKCPTRLHTLALEQTTKITRSAPETQVRLAARSNGVSLQSRITVQNLSASLQKAGGPVGGFTKEQRLESLTSATRGEGKVSLIALPTIFPLSFKDWTSTALQNNTFEVANKETKSYDIPAEIRNPAAAPITGDSVRSATSLLQRHSDILDNLDKWQTSYKELTQDKSRKKYCFDLLKAVTIPVNALANSVSVRDKLDQLTSILSGKPFQSGSRAISTSAHPLAQRFCLDKLAEKIVVSMATD
ncbi:unnamed protein product [Ixodes hexagonus]